MLFRPEDLRDLENAVEIRIETRRDEKSTRSTVIWIVVDQGNVFVRSVNGPRGRWYQEALAEPAVTIDDRGRRLEARAIPVHDADSARHVNEALQRKYASSTDGLPPMLTPLALEGTFRLEPQHSGEVPLEAPAWLGDDQPNELGPAIEEGMLEGGPAIEERVFLQPHKGA